MGVIGTITDGIKDGWDAVNAAKFSKNSRYLAAGEIRIAQNVFLDTVPYDRVYIADGLGFQGREYTLPVPGTSPREYVIHAGDGYYGMSKLKEDQKTLIHELTHVWQGQHTTWAWSYVFSSAWHQAGNSNAAYAYDKDNLKPWDDYNPEQQAKIVEDWFGDGMNTDDERYRYIVVNIRGQMFVPATDDPGVGTSQSVSKDSPPPPITDALLLDLLGQRFAANDTAGYGARFRQLQAIFASANQAEALGLYNRLRLKRPGDKVAELFQTRLSTEGRNILMKTLQARMAKK